MALEKKLTDNKGITTSYHRIENISMVNNLVVTVKSYTDESYRLKEKENEALIKKQEELQKQLQTEMNKTGEEYNKEKVIELTNQNNEIGFPVAIDLSVFTHKFEYPFDKDAAISYEAMYNKLKQEPMFEGAIDVFED